MRRCIVTADVKGAHAAVAQATAEAARVAANAARFTVDSAVLAMAEKLPGVPVPTLRDALAAAVERLAEGNVTPSRATALLRG
jgi:hypothetical protein